MIPKFRAWHKGNDEMIEVKEINYHYKSIYYNMGEISFDEFEIMQSTGLEDKNGKEIYEGDYLSWISFESHKEFKGEVVFSKGSFCMVVRLKGHDYKVPLHELSNLENLLEVLGNIYENPELLEVAE